MQKIKPRAGIPTSRKPRDRGARGNKSQAARLLGLSRNALRYRLSKIGIDDNEAE